MNYLTKTREELINVVEEQQQEIESLKALLKKQTPQNSDQKEPESSESDNKLKIITESSLDAIILMDNSRNITFWNPAAETLLGYSNEEAIGHNLLKLLAPAKYLEDQEKAVEVFRQTGDGPVINKVLELEAVRKDGKEISVELSISRIKIDNKWNALGFIRDISQRKQAEISLQQSERKFQNLIENINDVVYEVDTQGKIEFISSPIERIIGYNPEEIIGENFLDFVGENAEYLKKRLLLLNEKPEINNDYKVKSKSGEDRWVRLSTKAIIRNGQLVGGTGTLVDITATKLVELELQKSEALYRSIMKASPDTIVITDLNGNILFVSPSAIKMFGADDPELLKNKQMFDFLDKRSHPRVMEAIVEMQHGIFSGAEEFIGLKADETSFDIEVNGEFIRDENGQPTNMIFVIREITDRKKAEQALQKTQDKYRRLVENINDVVFDITLDGTIKYVSPSVEKIINLKAEDILGQNFLAFVHPDDRRFLIDVFENDRFDELKNKEYRYLTPEGKLFWIQVSAQFTYEDGKIVGRSGIMHDITERKLAEERLRKSEETFRNMVENINDVVYEVSAEGIVKYVSPSIERFLGYKPEELIGQNFFTYMHEEDRPMIIERLKDLDQRDYSFLEYRYYSKNKEIRWVRSSTNPTFEDGKIVGGRGVLIDITEQKKAEEKLKESEARFRMVFENVFDGISIFEENSDPAKRKLIDCNEQYAIMAGRSREELIETGYIYPLTQTIEENANQLRLNGLNEHTAFHGSFKWLRPDNKENTIEYIARPITWQGKQHSIGIDRDITEYKQKEEQLRKLSQAMEQSPVSIVITNLDGNIEYANPKACETTGYSLNELKGQNPRVLKSGETPIDEYQYLWNSITQKNTWRGIFHNKRKNGELYWESSQISPIINEQGEIISYLAIKEDITEKKKTEEKIRYQNDKLNAILKAIPDLIFINDKEGNYLEFFVSSTDKLLVNPDQIVGLNMRDMFDEKQTSFFINMINEAISQKETVTFDYSVHLPHSESTNFEARIVPFSTDKVLVLIRDTTEKTRKEAEIKRLSLAVEQSPVSIVITNLEANIEYVNPAFEQITGYSASEVIGKNTNILKSGETPPSTYKSMWETIENGKKWHGEWINKKKDGTLFWENVSITPIHDSEGNIINYLAIKQDITQRKQTEQEIRELNSNLEIKIEERTRALANSEKSYRRVVENVAEVIFQTDVDGKWVFLNNSWENITGFCVNESIGQNFLDYIYPDDQAKNLKLFEALIKQEKDHYHHEFRFLTKSGGICWIEAYANLGVNENDEVIGTYGTLQDITDRKQAEEDLKQLSTRLELALRVGGIGVWDYDIDRNNLLWDDQMFKIYGIQKDNFSSTYEAWLNGLYPDDRTRSNQEMQMAINEEKEYDTEFRVVWPDGSVHHIKALAALHPGLSTNSPHLIGINWDITLQKRLAEFENEMLQLSPKLTGIPLSEINPAINLALSRIGKVLNADRSYIFEFNANNEYMSNTFEWCNEGIEPQINDLQNIPGDMLPEWMKKLKRLENIIIESVADLPESWTNEREIIEYQNVKSLIVMPMVVEKNLIGFVGLDSVKVKKIYSPTEINILKVWSSMLSSLINNQRNENLLEQTRQNYETFFNTIDDFLWVLDLQGNIIHMNNTVKDRLEYREEELFDQSVLMVHPADRREEAGRIVGEMLAGTSEFCQVPVVTKSGKQIPVETRVKSGFWNGNPVIFGVSKDISQIQLSEQKFASAFQSNSAMMAISDFDNGKYLDVNNAFLENLDFTREEIIGNTNKALGLFVDPNLRAKIIETINKNIPIRKLEVLMRTKSGIVKTGLISADSIYIGDKRCLLTVNMDISERKKAEDELLKARQEADQANLAKSEFLSRMSHELRTPMNSILGFAQLLDMGELNAGQRKGVSHIMKSGKHLLDLINEVLDISRIESGRLSLSLEPVQLSSLIPEMGDVIRPQVTDRNITVRIIDLPDNVLFVRSDRQRLKQVLLNLMNNAVKYNRNGGSISIKVELRQNAMVRVSVIDTGYGIEEEYIPKLFTPFERVGADKTTIEGTGLGLSVVKKLMEAMGGTYGVESIVGEGSTFWIELPRSESQMEKASKSGNLDQNASKISSKTGTIIYIEDNRSNIELVEQILTSQRSDIELITDIHGKKAVSLAIMHKPDLILLDLNLPDIHGSVVLQHLQSVEDTRHIPVVVISADAMPQQLKKLLDAGAKNYLTKPLDIPEFLNVIQDYLPGGTQS